MADHAATGAPVQPSKTDEKKDLGPAHGARERKQRVLTHTSPSGVESIADAIVIKDQDLFFLCDRTARVPLSGRHGLGLYYHDCRFLNGYELHFGNTLPDVLAATAEPGYSAAFQLSNGVVPLGNGKALPKERIGIHWERVMDGTNLVLEEELTFRNHGVDHIDLPVSFHFGAAFEDIFVVRGLLATDLGQVEPPVWRDGVLCYVYHGSDGLFRSVAIHLSPPPDSTEDATAHYRMALDPQESRHVRVAIAVAEAEQRVGVAPRDEESDRSKAVSDAQRTSQDRWMAEHARVSSDSRLIDQIVKRSLLDMRMLRTRLRGEEFFAAGVPWFVTLFGRDSIIAALQMLAYDSSLAEQTLRLLATYQGREIDDWTGEQPGKIPHELRVGELARRGSIPFTPYYGSVDATPLFLILIAQHARWTGDLTLFRDLGENVERALHWIDRYGDLTGNGYVEYDSERNDGLANQGWKDSGDAIINDDGSLAEPPIALVEVQGYVYAAYIGLADLYDRAGEIDRGAGLREDANALRQRFNRDFWLEERGFYALALQKGNKPAAVLSSNPGHALWTAIADADKARLTVARLMGKDMFGGWGVRTLSATEKRYNPVGYHLGTVWPHDNSCILSGFRRYGHDDEALRVFGALGSAAVHFAHQRLPEVFAGYPRDEFGIPVRYPVACHPQAWAAGSVPFSLQALLGIDPDGFHRRLHVTRPVLPIGMNALDFRGLRVADGTIDLRFRRQDAAAAVEVLAAENVEVVVG